MAVKSLTSVVGGRHELGDIIRTGRTSMVDGRSLIPCDGQVIGVGTKPLLEAVLKTGKHMGVPAIVADSAGVNLFRGERFVRSATNDIYMGGSLEFNSNIQWIKGGSASVAISKSAHSLGGMAISADGNDSIFVGTEGTSNDLEIQYNQAGAAPETLFDIDAVGNYDNNIAIHNADVLMKQDGSICKVMANATDDKIHVWTSNADGNFGSAWSEITPISSPTSDTRFEGYSRGTDTLDVMVFVTQRGLWVSDDSGATWTQESVLPNLEQPHSVALTASGAIIYAVDGIVGNAVYKTTDKGVTWTILFEQGQNRTEAHANNMRGPLITHVEVDSSDNIYIFEIGIPDPVAVDHQVITLHYSGDAGATWISSQLWYTRRAVTTGSSTTPTSIKDLRVSRDGTMLSYSILSSANVDYIFESVLTSGVFPPNLAGDRWKMVAD